MLWKVSMTGIKSRMRDYLILFSGLAIASGIFYMFESLATNKDFLENSQTVRFAPIIFRFGTVLLAIITFVYVLYANSFMMVLRQKTYAMLIMLGAKTRKIAQLIFIETFIIGMIATVIGIVFGIGLTTIVNHLLVQQLDITVKHFTPISITAMIGTVLFFSMIFFITSILNAVSIVKKTILQLLKEQSTPRRVRKKPVLLFLETLLGVVCLGVSYYLLANIQTYKFMGIASSLVGIILGSYLLFHAIMLFVLALFKRNLRFSMKKINNFILSQLSFRVRDFTQMLTMVAIIFALALGALTVGLGFRNQIMTFTNAITPYDLVLNQAQKIAPAKIKNLDPTVAICYSQKEDEQTIYYNKEEFNQHPLVYNHPSLFGEDQEKKPIYFSGTELANDPTAQQELRNLELPEQKNKTMKFLEAKEFQGLALEPTNLQVVNVADFKEKLPQIESLVQENEKNNPSLGGSEGANGFVQKYYVYQIYNVLFSGFEFMGFFLGIAFLTMLASCLMFKILSSANADRPRYDMLRKIGTRQSVLKSAMYQEIGVLFLVPGVLGIVHVLFGLQMFTLFLSKPYQGIWLPITIFLVLYFIYYILTVIIYQGIVLPKENSQATKQMRKK